MSTITPNKTVGTSLLSLQSVASGGNVVGSSVSVANYLAGVVFIHFGRNNTTGPTAGAVFRIEAAATSATGAGEWYPLTSIITGITAAGSGANVSTSGSVQTVGTFVGTTTFVAQQIILIADGTTANSEWARITTGTTALACEETLQRSHTTGSTYNTAEMYAIPLDLSAVSQIRVVADGVNHGATFLCEAYLTLLQNLTVA